MKSFVHACILTQMTPEKERSPKPEEDKPGGVNTPAEITVLMHDGTGSMGLPGIRSRGVGSLVFACYSDMVAAGCFDSVELPFGPVGHTHNGLDAVHKIYSVVDMDQHGPPGDNN